MRSTIEPLENRCLAAIDLSVSFATSGLGFGTAGEWLAEGFEAEITIQIQGSTDLRSLGGSLLLSADRTLGPGDSYAGHFTNYFLNGIPADDSVTVKGYFAAALPAEIAAGRYYLIAQVDPGNLIAETGENNNVAISPKPVVQIGNDVLPTTTIVGTTGNDAILITRTNNYVLVSNNGVLGRFSLFKGDSITIDGLAGDDYIAADDELLLRVFATGSGGNDTLVGGGGSDELSGANGTDRLLGQGGDDYLLGGAANDYLNGESGTDICSGAGGNDRLHGGAGVGSGDYLIGGGGNDTLFGSRNSFGGPDTLSGGAGDDLVVDTRRGDVLASIEDSIRTK